ncbi:MAG: RNB domain-containing ribonuclease [Actinomycetota bacterium]|nr:RNB domain-containing ribonuclease [Actinomycetota bacterium]
MSPVAVCELARRGKLLVGEPFFEGGVPIVVDRRRSGDAAVGDLVVLRLGRGRARVERVLGRPGDVEAVLEALLWHEGVRRDAPPLPAEPSADESDRVDLRGLLAFTIDPEGAKDFDDSVSVRAEGDAVRAWVHIADVSAYVPAGSPLDRDAAERGFSTYVPGRVEPMLPERLSADLCSLRPHEDRRAVTVEIPFDAHLEPGDALFYRSLIRSRERLTYRHAQAILSGHERASEEIATALRLAERVATELRRRRYRRGALRIETGEPGFAFDGNGGVERAWIEEERLAHVLVEELMVLANEAVASLLAGRRRESLFRVHERPDAQAIELLLAKLADLDVPTPPAPERLTPGEAAKLAARITVRISEYVRAAGRGREAFPTLVLRALKQARYAPSNLGHSGLASRAYCHFTSPIRRYPDLVCHRALLNELGVASDPLPDDLTDVAEWTSAREREAAEVEYRADAICLAWYLEQRLFDEGWEASFEGEITGAIGSGIFVRFDGVFEGYLPARQLVGDYFELNPLATAMTGRKTGSRYRLGDRIEVGVESIDKIEGKVELRLAGVESGRKGRRREQRGRRRS